MRTAALLRSNGATVIHAGQYSDPAQGKSRQFDIRAELYHHIDPKRVRLAIECKSLSVDCPLVVSGSKRDGIEAYHHIVRSESGPGKRDATVGSSEEVSYIYERYKFVGKSIVRLKPGGKNEPKLVVGRDQESDIFGAWAQALGSAADLCRTSTSIERIVPSMITRTLPVQTVIVPAVVIPDGALWQAEYNDAGDFKVAPHQVEQTTFFIGQEMTVIPSNLWMVLSHIHFFTFTGLRQFLANLNVPTNYWQDWFPNAFVPYQPKVDRL
jgi:hypothetical protein